MVSMRQVPHSILMIFIFLAMKEFFNAWNNEDSPVYNVQVSLSRINNPEIATEHKDMMKKYKYRGKKKKGKGKKGKKKKKKKK